ncbi:MAG: hypothetical protein WCK35_03080 [Chloroflexota bacterium]
MRKIFLLLTLICMIFPAAVYAQGSDPWNEVFLPDGSLNPSLTDLGVTTEHPDWMSIQLPFGQTLNLDANYHRFQTQSGNIVTLPSASTLFFMAMNPEKSGLSASYGALGNGYGSMISFLGNIAGNSLNWSQIQSDHPEYKSPDQFWGAVLNGNQSAWTYFSGWSFITNMLQMTWNDAALRSMYLLYLNGSQTCTALPGGCTGINLPPEVPPLPPAVKCPDPTISVQQPTLSILPIAPAYPLVVGQDPNRRGADIQAKITVPPVIFTWHEPIYEDEQVCKPSAVVGGAPVCKTVSVFKECRQHVEHLPDAVVSLQATAVLDYASQGWITGGLGQTHYEAYVHKANFSLIPGSGSWTGGCGGGGTCTATGQALKVPFADPGTFKLRLDAVTSGTSFQGIQITNPRQIGTNGSMQVYVTLPALVK